MKLITGIIAAWFLVAITITSLASDEADRFVRMGWSNTDFSKTTIPLSEVMSGGPPRDGIPPIDNPQFQLVSAQEDLSAKDPVVSIEINGDARAYPLRVLIWHEIVNDTVGGKPVAVTYCPLCNAAIVFDRMVDGEMKDFGTTGLLRNSDLIMYDRQSESWWQQFTGQAIAGSEVGSSLKFVAARLESWADFTNRFPDGKVLVPNNPGFRNYGRNPYVGYDSAAAPFLYRGKMPEGISPMARVVVYRINGKTNAIALSMLTKSEELMHGKVTIKWKAGQASALDTGEIAKGRDVGSITVQKKNAAGNYEDIPYDVTFAFVVEAFEPGTVIQK